MSPVAQALSTVTLLVVVLGLLHVPLGEWMHRVFTDERDWRIERAIYRVVGVDSRAEQRWSTYAVSVVALGVVSVVFLWLLILGQRWLPWGMGRSQNWHTALNTAISFTTNTNWQTYAGEAGAGYSVQMVGLTVQNFLSAATGLAVAIALVRAIARQSTDRIGNFWVDLTRGSIRVLLPLAAVAAVILLTGGVIQNLAAPHAITTITGQQQIIQAGPVASQEAIKLLGTNGGGILNANSAHPFENPTAVINFLQVLAILLIPAGLCHSFGKLVRDRRQGWTILSAMMLLFCLALGATQWAEQKGNPALRGLPVAQGMVQDPGLGQPGGNLEGKEVRFGITGTALFATATTATSCGAVNGMHDSFTPLGGLVPMVLMQLGEVVFGGVGSGLYTMLIFAILAVFMAGLMVGRTPEYLGKKIEAFETQMASLVILIPAAAVLIGTALAVGVPAAVASLSNPGAHGFSQALYAFSSAANNNGSAFGGLSANTPFYNTLTALAMLLGRFGGILPVLAIAGSLAGKKRTPPGPGTLPTHGPLFIAMLVGVVVLVGALTYVPALALGPIAEHLALRSS